MLYGKRLSLLLAATAMTVVSGAPARAQSIEELKQQLEALSKRIEELEKQQKKTPKVTKSEPAFALSTDDGLFEFNIRGRVLADAAWVSDSDDTMDVRATEFRAARIGIEGKAWKNVAYKLEADFAGDEVELKDAYLEYKSAYGSWKFGQFIMPVSMEELTSSRHSTFMERASFTDAFNHGRQMGINYGTHGDVWSFNAGVFRGGNAVDLENEGYALAARATYGGKFDDGVWMVGTSIRYRDVGDGDAIRYRQRPHQHQSDRFLATARIATEEMLYGLEFAVQKGPFHAASEWAFLTAKDGGAGGRDANFYGGHVEAGWFITGESRPLKLTNGTWDRPKVNKPLNEGGMGAWQVAARYDRIDLTGDGVYGGEQDTYILGVNWYLNRHTRFMANYSHSDISKAFDVSANGADGENSVDALGLRFQVDW